MFSAHLANSSRQAQGTFRNVENYIYRVISSVPAFTWCTIFVRNTKQLLSEHTQTYTGVFHRNVHGFIRPCFVFVHCSFYSLHWCHNERDDVSNQQPHDCLLDRLFGRRSKKTAKLRVTGLCTGNSPVTGEFPAQMASSAENVSIWWRHHVEPCYLFTNIQGRFTGTGTILWLYKCW